MQIVYLGNRLAKWGYTPTSVETLGERLRELGEVTPYSEKKKSFIQVIGYVVGSLDKPLYGRCGYY